LRLEPPAELLATTNEASTHRRPLKGDIQASSLIRLNSRQEKDGQALFTWPILEKLMRHTCRPIYVLNLESYFLQILNWSSVAFGVERDNKASFF